jgi:hypothetical protein
MQNQAAITVLVDGKIVPDIADVLDVKTNSPLLRSATAAPASLDESMIT